MTVDAAVGDQTGGAAPQAGQTTDYPGALTDAIELLDHLLRCVRGPVAVLVVDRAAEGWPIGDRRDADQSSRLHTLIEPTADSDSPDGKPLVAVALAPLRGPAEGERLAQLWHSFGAETVGVAVSIESDDGDSLLAAALSAYIQAREFSIDGVIICPDDERLWTLRHDRHI